MTQYHLKSIRTLNISSMYSCFFVIGSHEHRKIYIYLLSTFSGYVLISVLKKKMYISEELKTSLSICNNSSVINDQVYKQLLEICFSELCRANDIPNVSKLCESKPDVMKELHASFLTVIAEFGRQDTSIDVINNFLVSECSFASSRSKIFCDLYEKHKVKLQIILGNIGSHLPNVIDVKWKMDYIIKSSDVEEMEGPVFRVSLVTEVYDEEIKRNKLDTIDFSCTCQELQDLVYKLREAMRHCMKIATER